MCFTAVTIGLKNHNMQTGCALRRQCLCTLKCHSCYWLFLLIKIFINCIIVLNLCVQSLYSTSNLATSFTQISTGK